MGLVSSYNNDVFISYSHIDNQSFGDPHGFTKAAPGARQSSRWKTSAGRQAAPHSAVGNAIKQIRKEPTASQAKSLRAFEATFKNQEM